MIKFFFFFVFVVVVFLGCVVFDVFVILLEFVMMEEVEIIIELVVEMLLLLLYESYMLDNGLMVIFYIDCFDLVVVVNLIVYVGLVCEKLGCIGFVYLFEYFLFFEFENFGFGGFDCFLVCIGGFGVNGFISCDCINYL